MRDGNAKQADNASGAAVAFGRRLSALEGSYAESRCPARCCSKNTYGGGVLR